MKTGPLTLKKVSQAKHKTDALDLSRYSKVLGDGLPHIKPDKVGRFRLLQHLRNKYGASYRNFPGVQEVIDYFDGEHKFHRVMTGLKME